MIVTVDCGSVSRKEVEYAESLGIAVLVTDHHNVSEENRAFCPLINPARGDSKYPFRYLAGCGVAFKFAQAITRKANLDSKKLTAVLDMVAIGTIGDVVSLTDENRTIVKYGLRLINTSSRIGLKSLINACSLKEGKISSENISFVIAPHINAAGRMKHASLAVELFLCQDESKAAELAEELCACNRDRKNKQEEIYEECVRIVKNEQQENNFLVLVPKSSDEGIAGIVAGKIKEKFYRPTVILTDIGTGLLKGTGRSIEGLNLYDILKTNEHMYTAFGGHKMACGFTIKEEFIDEFCKNLNDIATKEKEKNHELFEKSVLAELRASVYDLDLDFAKQIEMLAPFGTDNEKPLVQVNAYAENPENIGKDGKYLRFSAIMEESRRLQCVAFSSAEEIRESIESFNGNEIQIVGSLNINEWNSKSSLQMLVESVEEI